MRPAPGGHRRPPGNETVSAEEGRQVGRLRPAWVEIDFGAIRSRVKEFAAGDRVGFLGSKPLERATRRIGLHMAMRTNVTGLAWRPHNLVQLVDLQKS